MKKLLLSASVLLSTMAFAQISTPQPSPTATIKQTVGLTDFEVVYSRPSKKGRKIFGDLVAYGQIWRTGANASTKIKFADNAKFAGNDVPAGEYAIYTIPNENEWTIIIHKSLKNWGAGEYNQNEDLVRFNVKPTKLTDVVESFTIDFSNFDGGKAHLNLMWDNVKVSIPVETDVSSKVMSQIKAQLIDSDKEAEAGTYFNAARYYFENGHDINLALKWVNKAVEKRPEAFWYTHVQAKILAKSGNKKEALKAAEKSLEMAKANKDGDFGYTKMNEELIAELKAKK